MLARAGPVSINNYRRMTLAIVPRSERNSCPVGFVSENPAEIQAPTVPDQEEKWNDRSKSELP